MQRKGVYLSLGNWPTTPPQHPQPNLTPITKRILNKVNLIPSQILPISFLHFVSTYPNVEHSQQIYKQENQRRNRKVRILEEIRNKYILGKDYSQNKKEVVHTKSLLNFKLGSNKNKTTPPLKPNSNPNNNLHNSNIYNKFANLHNSNKKNSKFHSNTKSERKSKAGLIRPPLSRTKMRESSDYFIHYNPHQGRQKKFKKKSVMEEESTKSKDQKAKKCQESAQSQYGAFFTHKPQSSVSRDLCHQLLVSLQEWEALEMAHVRQTRVMGSLNDRERERLAKMQSVEKGQMKRRITKIKSRLNSQNYQI